MKAHPSDLNLLIGAVHRTSARVAVETGPWDGRPLLVTSIDLTEDRLADTHTSVSFTLLATGLSLAAADDLFEPLVHELAVHRGVYYPGSSTPTEFRRCVVRVTDAVASRTKTGISIRVEGFGREDRIRTASARPQSIPAAFWDIAIRRLIRLQFPEADFTDDWPSESAGADIPGRMTAPNITIDEQGDKWSKCKDGFANIGKEGYPDDAGRFGYRDIPDVNVGEPVWTYAAGMNCGMVETSKSRRGADTWNGVVVTGVDGARGEWWNDDTDSPTSTVHIEERAKPVSTNLRDSMQCTVRAQSEGRRIRAGTETATFSAFYNPALETGDLIRLRDLSVGLDGRFIVNRIEGRGRELSDLMSVTAGKS